MNRYRRFNAPALAVLVMVASFADCVWAKGQKTPVAAIGARIALVSFMSAPGFKLSDIPSGVVSTDLDGDGKPDLVVAFARTGEVVVYLGEGMGKFQAPVAYSAGGHPVALLAVDFDGDGRRDIVTANGADGTISVLPGGAGGRLGAARVASVGVSADYLAASDLNGDGLQDVVVASRSGKALGVLLNDSHGSLQAVALQALGKTPTGLATGDFDGDRHIDVAVASDDGTVEVLVGRGDGTLRIGSSFVASTAKIGSLAVADFNRDGSLDLAVTERDGRLLTTFLGKGDGTFGQGVSQAVGNLPVFTAAIDVNGDGLVDLLSVNQGSNTVSVLLGKGDGSFERANSFAVGDGPVALAAGDYYSTGVPGLVVVDASGKTLNAVAGRGDGTFRAAASYSGDLSPRALASGDLNGDGLADLVVANFCGAGTRCASGSLSVYLGQAAGGYKLASTRALGVGPVAVALADLNGDGNLDVVALNRGGKTLSVLLGVGDGTFEEQRQTPLMGSPVAVVAREFNQDGKIDLAVVSDCGAAKCTQPGSVEVYFGGGDGSFVPGASYAVNYSPSSLAAGDLNGDGVLDLVVANGCGKDADCTSGGTATVLLGGLKGSFTAQTEIPLNKAPSSIGLRRVTSQGALDLVVTHEADDTLAVLNGNGDGTFQGPVLYSVGSSPRAIAIADLNGDGVADVAVANAKDSTVSVLYGRADGTLVGGEAYAVAAGPEALTAVGGVAGARASLVTANGNTSSSTAGTEITSLLNALPNAGSTPSMAVFSSVMPANPTVNTAVRMQVKITPAPADGEAVTFLSDDVGTLTCTSAPMTIGSVATCTTSQLTVGSRSLTANYGGDATYMASTAGPQTLAVSAAPATLALALSSPATTATVNQSATYTATLSSMAGFTPTSPSGIVSFLINGQAVSGCPPTPVSGAVLTASCTYTAQTAGSLPVGATYTNDANFTVANQPSLSQTINAAPATLTLTGPSTATTVNQNVTFLATLASSAGFTPTAPSGVISIAIAGQGGATCQPTMVSNTVMTASCSITALAAGSLSAVATYAGDTNFVVPGGSSSTLAQTINRIPTTLSLSQPNPSAINTNVTFTATLNATRTTPTTPGGVISFTVNGDSTACPAVMLSGGSVTATCVTSKLVYPSDVVVATYSGDANYTTAPPVAVTQIVSKTNAQTTVSASPGSAVVNQPVTFTATLQGLPAGQVVPSGNVTFRQGSMVLCGGAVAIPFPAPPGATSTAVNCQTSFSAVNATGYTVTATYSGDSNFNPGVVGTSAAVLVGPQATTLGVASTVSPSAVDQVTTFTATISSTYAGTVFPTGTINFVDQTTSPSVTLCASPISSAGMPASCTVPLLYAGVHAIVASFTASSPGGGASPNFGSSTSSVFPQAVNPAGTMLSVSTSSASVAVNAPVTFTATVMKLSDSTYTGTTLPAGTIAFSDGPVLASATPIAGCTAVAVAINGTAQCQQATLATAGTHTINAIYTPSTTPATNFLSSSGNVPQVVNPAPTSIAINSSVSSPIVDEAVTFAAALTFTAGSGFPTGVVKFTDTSTGSTATGTVFCTVPLGRTTTPLSATCSTSPYAFVTSGIHQVTATYAGDANFTTSASTFSVSVGPTPTTLAVTASSQPSPAVVDQPVTLAISLTTNPATQLGMGRPQGTVTVMDSVLNRVLCTQTVAPDGSVPTCTSSFLAVGSHTLSAIFAPSDANFTGSSAPTITQVVQPTATTLTVTSSSGVTSPISVATQAVTFTAILVPTFTGATLPAGSVAFTLAGDAVDTCPTAAVNTSAQPYTATCTVTFANTISGAVTVKAAYTPTASAGGANFQASTGASTQNVQNFQPVIIATSLATAVTSAGSPVASPIVTQGYTTATDPFNPSTITVSASSSPSFADPLTVASCVATNSAGVALTSGFCTIGGLANAGTGTIATLTLSPTTSTPAGVYTLTVALADSKVPSLLQTTTLAVNVVPQVIPSSLSAGAATGAFNVPFSVPSPAASYTFACSTILFNGQVSTAISCEPGVTPGTVSSDLFTITAGPVSSAMALPVRQPAHRIFTAALIGVPLFALAGCLGRRGSGTSLLRLLAGLIVLAGALQVIGCGGGFTVTSATSAITGPAVGTYLVLVTAKDTTTGATYDAVISVAIKSATGS